MAIRKVLRKYDAPRRRRVYRLYGEIRFTANPAKSWIIQNLVKPYVIR